MSEQVQQMFADIAPQYDKTNTVLSLGIHHLWRSRVVRDSGAKPGMSVLDCATGTGDLAIAFKKAVGNGRVVGTDFCREMLSFAPQKAYRANTDIAFEVADVLSLPYPENSFDIASISFGIRNVDSPIRALQEMARVVRPGGRVMVLEFGQPGGFLALPYRFYSRYIIPALGSWLTGSTSAYQYLPRTASQFPSGKEFVELMRNADVFSQCSSTPLTFGIAFLYSGIVR